MFSRRRDSAHDAACGKLENSPTRDIILNSRLTFEARLTFHPRCSRTLLLRTFFLKDITEISAQNHNSDMQPGMPVVAQDLTH